MAIQGAHLASSNYLETAASNWFQPARTITVMFWARPASAPPNGNYWSLVGTTHSASVAGWACSIQGGVSNAFWEMFFTNNGTNYDDFRFTNAIATGRWDHVAWVMRSDATEAGYLNGVAETLVQASNAGTYPATASRALRIRYGDSTGNGTFDGGMAYLRIFDGELSGAEIRAEMMSRRAVNRRLHVICDFPLTQIGGSNIVAPDLGPQGLHVTTINGTVTWDRGPVIPEHRSLVLPKVLFSQAAGGGSTVNLTPATFAFSGVAVTPVPQPVTIALSPAIMSLGAVAVTPVPQPVTVALTPASVAFTAVPVTPVPQPVTIALTPAVLTLSAVALGVGGVGAVSLTPAVLGFSGVSLDPHPQPVTINLAPAVFAFSAVGVVSVPQPVTVNLAPAVLVFIALALLPPITNEVLPPPIKVSVPTVMVSVSVPMDRVSVDVPMDVIAVVA